MFVAPVVFTLLSVILYLLPIADSLKLSLLAFSSAVVAISLTSIGINIYKKCKDKLKDDEMAKNDEAYLIGILILSVISCLVSLYFVHMKAKTTGAYEMIKNVAGFNDLRGVVSHNRANGPRGGASNNEVPT